MYDLYSVELFSHPHTALFFYAISTVLTVNCVGKRFSDNGLSSRPS